MDGAQMVRLQTSTNVQHQGSNYGLTPVIIDGNQAATETPLCCGNNRSSGVTPAQVKDSLEKILQENKHFCCLTTWGIKQTLSQHRANFVKAEAK